MDTLAPLIADLALILICAGIMTLIFKKLKQPLVLGYIVAGFIASPHFTLTPSVMDAASIHVWSDIGVIFLLFALGLEFSFKKIVKVGGPAIIAALTIIFGMIFLGFTVGSAFGWSKMDALFLGGMISMSSTTIIYKAFEDLGLAKKKFAGLVMSILILEDILAVVLMVVLSTVAVSAHPPQDALAHERRNPSGGVAGPVLHDGGDCRQNRIFRRIRRLHHGLHPVGNAGGRTY